MKATERRIEVLEAGRNVNLPPPLKAWLGWPITDAEQQAPEDDAGVDQDFDDIDTSDWSQELRAWLGID